MKKFLRSLTLVTVAALGFGSAKADVTTLLDADFSVLTAGSEESPDLFTSEYGLYRFDSSIFSISWKVTPNLSGQAGGSLYLGDGGSVTTPSISGVTTTGGAIKVSMEIKLNQQDMGVVELYYGGSYSTLYSTTQLAEVEGTDWQTIEFIITPQTNSTSYNGAKISPYLLASGMFIRNLTIEQSPDFLSAPTATQPTVADATSFTATWKEVTGATKYFLDVYHYGSEGQKVYKLENEEVTGTSYEVTGLVPGFVYYYVVRAGNDDGGVSSNSNEIEVVKVISSLAQPEVSIKSVEEDGTFTAVWAGVANADGYNVTVTKKFVLTEPGEADVFSEDFNSFTSGTIDRVNYIYYGRGLENLNEPGWTGADFGLCYINGALGLIGEDESYLATPAIDLSNGNGDVTVVINAACAYGTSYNSGTVISFTLVDDAGNETEPVDLTLDTVGFTDYTVNLTGGTSSSKVKISLGETSSLYKVFFDSFVIRQEVPAGTTTTTTYINVDTEATEYTGQVEFADETEYTLVVTALGRTVSGGQITEISSDPSEAVAIEFKTSGVENVATDSAKASVKVIAAGTIEVSVATATTVEVFDLTGRKVAATTVSEGTTTLTVDAKGIVIVKAGDTTAKLTL